MVFNRQLLARYWRFLYVGVLLFYLSSHLVSLTLLPVFADEAIYIRWSQLIIDDAGQYLFFPLNDGKTPLQMWLMVPFLQVFADPLFAGRFLSVLIGFIQMIVMSRVVIRLGGGRVAQIASMLMTALLPFWFFYHRMALIDALLTLCLSVTTLGLIEIVQQLELHSKKPISSSFFSALKNPRVLSAIVVAGISFGAALWTKVPAIFFSPVFTLFVFLPATQKKGLETILMQRTIAIGVAGAIGLLIFLSMRLHPAFGQLFGRGSDFTFTLSELLSGQWKTSIDNIIRITGWNGRYLSYAVMLLSLSGLLLSKHTQRNFILLLSAYLFAAPFIFFGRVLTARYVLPMAVFFTSVSALVIEEYLLSNDRLRQLFVLICTLLISLTALPFLLAAYLQPNVLPLHFNDREQYLEEWSSGHGIKKVSDRILSESQTQRVFLASEGYFGTLPDGVLMYLHNQDVSNLEVIGIGQPIMELPTTFIDKSSQAGKTYLLVNSHRMFVQDPRLVKVESFQRPNNAPTLDLYEFKKQE